MEERIKAKINYINLPSVGMVLLDNLTAPLEKGEVVEIVRDDRRKARTLSQNAFFHLMLAEMIPYFDRELDFFSREDIENLDELKLAQNWKLEMLKSFLKREYLAITIMATVGGRDIPVEFIPSTAALKIGAFCEFTEKCIKFFSEAGAPIDAFLLEYDSYKGKYF